MFVDSVTDAWVFKGIVIAFTVVLAVFLAKYLYDHKDKDND